MPENKINEDSNKDKLIENLRAEIASYKKSKKFGLVFEEKGEKIVDKISSHVPYLSLRADKSFIVNRDAPTHELIKGDNYAALLTLLPEYKGKIDVIYIDPPYNTGNNDFIYNDRYVDKEDGYRHSTWLSFMKRRLSLAKELLSENGVIFVSIDDNEQAHLRILMDEIFGEQNFVSNIIWDGGLKNNSRFISVGHDYILTYTKNKSCLVDQDVYWREPKKGYDDLQNVLCTLRESELSPVEAQLELRKWINSNKESIDPGLKNYNNIDENWNLFRIGDLSSPGGKGSVYEVIHPITQKPVKRAFGGWRYSKTSMDRLLSEGLIHFGKDHSTVPGFKRILNEENISKVPRSVFWAERAQSNKLLAKILGGNAFDFPKDHEVLKRWINAVSKKDSIILDFFAGSGSTGHAVAELNYEDGGNRKCILVTDSGKSGNADNSDMSDKVEEGVDIAEDIAYERMRRVLTGEDWVNPDKAVALNQNLLMREVKFVSTKDNIETLGEGFKPVTKELSLNKTDVISRIITDQYSESNEIESSDLLDFTNENKIFYDKEKTGKLYSYWSTNKEAYKGEK